MKVVELIELLKSAEEEEPGLDIEFVYDAGCAFSSEDATVRVRFDQMGVPECLELDIEGAG